MGLYGGLRRGIEMFGFLAPTPLQKKAIPAINKEDELIVEAVTSCGKTVSFAISVIQQLLELDRFDQILVIAQHFEASVAISNLIKSLAKFTRVTCIDCGHANEFNSMNEFAGSFDRTTNIIVGSPYQMQFLVAKKTFYINSIKMVVVDDADKLFEEGFNDHVSTVFNSCNPSVKKVFLCRTVTSHVSQSARQLSSNLVKVLMESDVDLSKFKHYYVDARKDDRKFALLCEIYRILGLNKALIYCNSDLSSYELQKRLQKQGIRIIEIDTLFSASFEQKNSSKISATVVSDNYKMNVDLDVELIINYDFPMFYETYKQRLNGRLSNVKAMVSLVTGFEVN
ncbi:ATP-dependent RNA helicase FAL1-like protein, partial [Leptotrombidium deliense]